MAFLISTAFIISGSFSAVTAVSAENDPSSWADQIDAMLKKEAYEENSVIAVFSAGTDQGEELALVSAETAEETLGIQIPDTVETVSVRVIRDKNKKTRELLKELSRNDAVLWAEPNYIMETFGEESIPPATLIEPPVHHDGESMEIPDGLSRLLLTGTSEDLIETDGYEAVGDLSRLQWGYGTSETTEYDESVYNLDTPDWNQKGRENVQIDDAVVAVIDSGIDYTHPDLKDVMVDMTPYGLSVGGRYGFNPSGEGDPTDPIDDENGHGTHCAGIIAASWDNEGISGVASGVKLLAVKTSKEGEFKEEATVRAFTYLLDCVNHGVNLVAVNCSFGGDGCENATRMLINELGKHGVVVCYAAGNSALDNDLNPQSCSSQTDNPYVIVVGASTPTKLPTDYTHWGQTSVSLFAPGDAILSTVPGPNAGYFASVDPNPVFYEGFSPDDAEDDKVKISYLYTIDITENAYPSVTPMEFAELVDTSESYGGPIQTMSFDQDGYAYEVDVPAMADKNKRSVYLVSIPVTEDAAKHISHIGAALRSTLPKCMTWFKPVIFDSDDVISSISLPVGGDNDWQRPSCVWTNHTVKTGEDTEQYNRSYPYYNGRIYYLAVVADFSGNNTPSKLYIDSLGGGTKMLKYQFYQGTSMATPSVTGSVAVMYSIMQKNGSLDGMSGSEKAIAVANAVKASTTGYEAFDGLCTSRGLFSFDVKPEDYAPVINTAFLGKDNILTITGEHFGTSPGSVTLAGQKMKITSWSDTEVTADLSGNTESGPLSMYLITAEDRKAGRKILAEGNTGTPLFEGSVTMPEEIRDSKILSMTGINGRLYLVPKTITGDYTWPVSTVQLWSYDPVTDSWKKCSDIPIPEEAKSEDRSCTVDLTSYGNTLAACVLYKAGDIKNSEGFVVEHEYRVMVYFYNPEKDSWTYADFGDQRLPMYGKLFGSEHGLFYVGGYTVELVKNEYDEEAKPEPGEVNSTSVLRLVYDESAVTNGEASVRITGLPEAGTCEETVNMYAEGSTFKDTAAFVAPQVLWLSWSEADQKWSVSGSYEFSEPSFVTIGGPGDPVAFIPSYAGSLTDEGLLMAGFPGSYFTKRGYDTFRLDPDGTMTPFNKFASYADLYDTRTCYTDGYLYVWGTSYFNGDGSISHLTWTKTDSSDPSHNDAQAEQTNAGMMIVSIIGLIAVSALAIMHFVRRKPAQ
ncbi:MAG: S8 family serine peptidase [Solobacterium sp.]|nr:S8 family serine peptidase [Solobacterium sp.]